MRHIGIGTKILVPVTVIFVVFTVVLASLIGYIGQGNLTSVKQAELERMSNILANNIVEMSDNAAIIARSMEQNERISREIAQLMTYGPFYADPGATVNPYRIATEPEIIEDAEQIFALQANLNLIPQLQTIIQTNNLSSISFYQISPYDIIQTEPTLSLRVSEDMITLSRFDLKGSGSEPMFYQASIDSYEPPSANYFDISSIYALSPHTFYAERQFQRVFAGEVPHQIEQPTTGTTAQTDIIYRENVPILRTRYRVQTPLPHPETWEPQPVAAMIISIEQNLNRTAINSFKRRLQLDVGLLHNQELIVSSLPEPLDTARYYTAQRPIGLGAGELGVIVFSPRAELQALTRDLQLRIVTIAVGTLLIGGVIVYIAIQVVVTRPLQTLIDRTLEIERGQLASRVPLERNDELGQLARAFNTMASRLEALVGSLEERISARTRDLKAAIDLSRQITTVLTLDDLLPQVVWLTSETYELHAVSIFIPNDDTNTLEIAAHTGDCPAPSIRLDQQDSLIAAAATTRQTVFADRTDTRTAYTLPDGVASEIAIPMMLGSRFIGVFDVCSQQGGRFEQDEINALEVLTKQTAIAVRNAQLFAALREANIRAQEANKAKSAFLASVSHELRTPLNSIINFTEFVKHGMMGPVNDQQVETLGEVTTASQHLLNLINDVLDMSKIESGSLSLYIQDNVDLTQLLQQATHTARNLLRDKPVAVRTEIPNLPNIRADEQRVLQIFLNIVSNACKFTAEGHVCIRAYVDGDSVEVAIEDTGPGIAENDADRVFEKFQQTRTGLRDGNGTGLGMPISRVLAESHYGRMWFESKVGEGTTFFVRLPVKSPHLKVFDEIGHQSDE